MEDILEELKKNPELKKINEKYSSKIGINEYERMKVENAKVNQDQ